MGCSQNNILYVTHSSAIYGANQCLIMLIKALPKRYNPIVYLNSPGSIERELIRLNIPYFMCTAFTIPLRDNLFNFKKLLQETNNRFKYLKILKSVIKANRIELVHLNSFYAHYASIITLFSNVKLVWHIRETPEFNFRNRIKLLLMKKLADSILFVSKGTESHFPKKYGQADVVYDGREINPGEEFIKLVSYGAKELKNQFKSTPDQNIKAIIGIVGELSSRKGTDIALELIKNSLAMRKDIYYVFFGDKNQYFKESVQPFTDLNHQVFTNVKFMGFVQNMHEYFGGIDILFHPARKDPFPGVILESMLYSIPVVASKVDGIPEMVQHGETGYCFNVGDVGEAHQYIEDLINDVELRHELGRNGRLFLENNYSLRRHTESMEKIYQKVLR